MTATYLNKFYDSKFYCYDLLFIKEDVEFLRLNGVIFDSDPSEEDFTSKAIEIATSNFPDYEITQINF